MSFKAIHRMIKQLREEIELRQDMILKLEIHEKNIKKKGHKK